jgi:hypothetical protein
VRLGVVWAVLLLPALFAGPGFLALLVAPVAGVAAAQTARTWRHHDGGRPVEAIAALDAAAIVGASAVGVVGCLVAVVAAVFITVGYVQMLDAR